MLLSELPQEIIEEILVRCDPVDVASVAQTCFGLHSIVYCTDDYKLWRELYLSQLFDDPRMAVSQQGYPRPLPIDWRTELQRIMRLRTVLDSEDCLDVLRLGEVHDILDTILEMVTIIPPRKSDETMDELSSNLMWVAAMLRRGFLDRVEQADESKVTKEDRQRVAQLHTYYGVTHADVRRQSRVKSRAFVYNMRHYRPDTKYGPFREDGKVNWEHMQALHHVVSMHIVDLHEDEDFEFAIFPMSLPYTQIVIPDDLDEENDWAGISGSWAVSFCFCDHRDLLLFNDSSTESGLDMSLFEDPNFREVFRSIDVTLYAVRTEPDPDHPTRPIIHFFGQMQDPSTSTMTGHVNMTPDDQVQWHFVSGEAGSTIWSSEGIQVGGLRSSFGVLGAWTTIFHDHDDPVGPFWLRKHIHNI